MHIGLIGGIGPAATVIYYQRLVAGFRSANLPLSLTISHADIDVLAANARADNRQAQAEVFALHLNALQAAGCDVALITALTGHFCINETKALSDLRLLDGVEVVDSYCREQRIGVLGLLGSPPVMGTQLFGMLTGVRTAVPKGDLGELGRTYMTIASSGECKADQRSQFFAAAAGMVEQQAADAILLAGTDLGLVFTEHELPFPIIDAVDLHVEALVRSAAGFHGST